MQITLNQEEIELALDAFVRSQITVSSNQKIVFDLKAGRGESGFSATLDIVPAEVQTTPSVKFRDVNKPRVVDTAAETVTETAATEPAQDEDVVEGDVEADEAPTEAAETTDDAAEQPGEVRKGGSLFSKTGS